MNIIQIQRKRKERNSSELAAESQARTILVKQLIAISGLRHNALDEIRPRTRLALSNTRQRNGAPVHER